MIKRIFFDWRIKIFLEKTTSFMPFGYDYKMYSHFGHKFLDIKNFNCNKIKTLDHISHLNKGLMISVVQSLFEKLDNIAIRFGQDIQRLNEKYNRINTQGKLGDLLSSCNI